MGTAGNRYLNATSHLAGLEPLRLAEFLVLGRQHNATDLAVGSPSFPSTGKDLTDAACIAIRNGLNQYADPAGHPELRQAVARLHQADPDSQITITSGASVGLAVALRALAGPGDEVIIFEPFFEVYPAAVRLVGAQPRFVSLREPGWSWDPAELQSAFGPRTKAVIINSPHNPTGRALSEDELRELLKLCGNWGSVLISDEVYIEFADRPDSLAQPGKLDPAAPVVTIRSLSKSHAISGWRIGWLHAAPELTRVFRIVNEMLTCGSAAPLQAAAAQILGTSPGWSDEERRQLAGKRRRLHAESIAAGLSGPLPEAGAYLFMRLADKVPGARAVAKALITEYGLTLAPGTLFIRDAALGDRYLRLAFNKSDEVLDAGISRLNSASTLLKARR